MKWDASARDRHVLGSHERLSLLGEDSLENRHREAMAQLQCLYGLPEAVPLASFFANLAHSPEFFAGYMALGIAASTRSALPLRLRELAILRTAWLHGAPYAWGEHVHATRKDLFSRDDIGRIVDGSGADGWSDLDRSVLRAAEDLHEDAMISDATWNVLAEYLDERQLLELPLVIGHYVTTAYLQNSLRTRLTDYGKGLSAR